MMKQYQLLSLLFLTGTIIAKPEIAAFKQEVSKFVSTGDGKNIASAMQVYENRILGSVDRRAALQEMFRMINPNTLTNLQQQQILVGLGDVPANAFNGLSAHIDWKPFMQRMAPRTNGVVYSGTPTQRGGAVVPVSGRQPIVEEPQAAPSGLPALPAPPKKEVRFKEEAEVINISGRPSKPLPSLPDIFVPALGRTTNLSEVGYNVDDSIKILMAYMPKYGTTAEFRNAVDALLKSVDLSILTADQQTSLRALASQAGLPIPPVGPAKRPTVTPLIAPEPTVMVGGVRRTLTEVRRSFDFINKPDVFGVIIKSLDAFSRDPQIAQTDEFFNLVRDAMSAARRANAGVDNDARGMLLAIAAKTKQPDAITPIIRALPAGAIMPASTAPSLPPTGKLEKEKKEKEVKGEEVPPPPPPEEEESGFGE